MSVMSTSPDLAVLKKIENYFNGQPTPPSNNSYIPVVNPATGEAIAHVASSDSADIEPAIASATRNLHDWQTKKTVKSRAACLLKLHALIQEHTQELAELIVQENGKNLTEAIADVSKANETVEYAAGVVPHVMSGRILPVSAGGGNTVVCRDERRPVGVVLSIVPFNFPLMVPCWTIPLALVLGNAVILKPSEKVPLTTAKCMELVAQAGIPPGILTLFQTNKSETITTLLQHPTIQAVTFVGSSPVAEAVANTCQNDRRCLALGGAKNHLVALTDSCDIPSTASDVVVSFAGCAGQRCMAASVLLIVNTSTGNTSDSSKNNQDELLEQIVRKAKAIELGTNPGQMGPVITPESLERIHSYISDAVDHCDAKLLLDGRQKQAPSGKENGNWIGPTILLHSKTSDKALHDEIFGPVLSVYVCSSWKEAVAIENASPYGNAACIYTQNGGHAEWFLNEFRAGMLGCNIGIPVPREPFSFGGLFGTRSKLGTCLDITGEGAIEFFTNRIKVTTRWAQSVESDITTKELGSTVETDHANFAGSM